MAVPLIKKAEVVEVIAPWRKIVLVATAVMFAIVGLWSTLVLVRIKQTRKLVDQQYQEIEKLNVEALRIAAEAKASKRRLSALSGLIGTHVYPASFLKFLEDTTLPEVAWKTMEVEFKTPGKMLIEGRAKGYKGVAQQLERFKGAPNVTEVTLRSAALEGAGGVAFEVGIFLDHKIWTK